MLQTCVGIGKKNVLNARGLEKLGRSLGSGFQAPSRFPHPLLTQSIMLKLLLLTLLPAVATAETPLLSDDYLLHALLHEGVARRARALQPGGGPPPGGGGGGGGGGPGSSLAPGAVSSTTCPAYTCTTAGGGNYMTRSLTLNTATGVFSGSLTTNGCPNHAGAYQYSGVLDARVPAASASCQTWTLPVSGYVAGVATAAPLRSSIGYTISGGEAIYGPMDAGFTLGQVTTTSCGSCPAGTDTRFCAAYIERACGTAALKGNTSASMHMLLSDCGGHAGYHNHESLSCEYSAAAAGHSGLVAVLLDGRGVYGQYESTGVRPTDLDACGGHMGPTPATTVGADTYPSTASTYHYHMTTEAPFVAGCFGPVTSLAAAKALYPSCAAGGAACVCSSAATCTCSAGQVMGATCTALGSVAAYTLDCPVYRMGANSQGTINANDPSCVPCAGNCATPSGSGSGSGSTTSAGSNPASSSSVVVGAAVGGTLGALVLAAGAYYMLKARAAKPPAVARAPTGGPGSV